MTVPIETSRADYAGNGVTTVFSTVFYFLESTDLRVVVISALGVETTLAEGVNYTVTMPASVGAAGSVTVISGPPAVGETLRIERDVSIIQDTSFRTQGNFSPAVHEDAMDRLMFAVQELLRRVGDLESAGAPGSVIAGDGLFFSGLNLHVGAGAGITANPNDVAVNFGPAPTAVYAGGTYDGVDDHAARADHGHDVAVAAPSALAVGDTTAGGASGALARADHGHAVPVIAVGSMAILDSGAADAGSSGEFADGAHKHEVKSGLGAELTDAVNSAGAGPGFTLEGHSHAHGARGGGTLHATATTADAGFMSAADKSLMAAVSESTVQTSDATVTTIATVKPTNTKGVAIRAIIIGKDKATANTAGYGLAATAKRQGGVTTLTGAVTVLWSHEDVAGWDAAIDVSTPDVRVRVTGAADTNIDWRCRLEVIAS